jgi:hypothetical protein
MFGLDYDPFIPAILACGGVSLVLGFIWYGPLFGRTWSRYTGWTDEKVRALPKKSMATTYVLALLAAIVTAFVLDILAWEIGASTLGDGLRLGLWTGLGFSAMAFATTHLFERKPAGLWLVVAGYQLVYQVAAAVIVTLWR